MPVGSFYGYPTGIVGLRLFPNPNFDAKAKEHWDAAKYYANDPAFVTKDLVRPYRVGMACAFCHVGPNPLKPPADPNSPKWENLSSNVGAQYFWFDRIFAVNVKALYLSALELVPVFRAQGGGVVINIASTAGIRPRPGLTVYNASKAAAIGFSKSMAVEFAPDNICVNAVCPVAGETPLLGEFMGGDTPERRAKFVGTVPLGRLSQPRDVANAVAFLASDEAAFITGVALEVDGGRCV